MHGTRPDPTCNALSKDLKQRGFNFAGSTICYAFMQAVGMVNDHVEGCFRRAEVRKKTRPAIAAHGAKVAHTGKTKRSSN